MKLDGVSAEYQRMGSLRSFVALAAVACLAAGAVSGCSSKVSPPTAAPTPRTYAMGFSGIPPRPDFNVLLQAIQMWSTRADAAIIHEEPPWDSLLAGVPPRRMIIRDKLSLANYYRSFGHEIVVVVDATNGLNRTTDSQKLLDAGRSLTEAPIQQIYRRWCFLLDSILEPDYMGLAAETNLIRAGSPPALYQAVVGVADGARADIRAGGSATPLAISIQVETAWGGLGSGGTYVGIAQDLSDFAWMDWLGLSSYPYFSWTDPDDLPEDYYARIANDAGRPVMVVEGGWSSASLGPFTSSPATQSRYISKQAQLLDAARAIGVFQLTFTDLDTTSLGLPPGSILPLFAALGLVDENLSAKPALAAWDGVFARPRQ